MTAKAIIEMIRQKPFEPLRVVMSGGETYEIRHPEQAHVMEGGLLIVYPSSPRKKLPDRMAKCSWLHISSVDTLFERGSRNGGRR
jgi:hypothetical protein